jgi:UDP-glucose:(heptosyl)LPS alpha-1,3-glucosyltransferase
MTLAFCIYKYFPFGGAQRDFLRIAKACQQKGYCIRVYLFHWQGQPPSDFELIYVPVKGLTNHGRYQHYHQWVTEHLEKHRVSAVIGFQKMPGLDFYFAADSCYLTKMAQRPAIQRLTKRYRLFSRWEQAVFSPTGHTQIFILTRGQQAIFQQAYHTPANRFHLLPPGIAKDRIAPFNAQVIGEQLRQELGINHQQKLLLMVGSGFKTKGLDRALMAVASLPAKQRQTLQFYIIGQDKTKAFKRLVKRLRIEQQVHFLQGRSDVPDFLFAADLLIHPAYYEVTGTVLLEALVAGLPVIATDICGYAPYIEQATMGQVISSPFQQTELNKALGNWLAKTDRQQYRAKGQAFAQQGDIFQLVEKAASIIQQHCCH